ncbi:MAG: NUDIX domain-containing protein [Actinomycetota bacterium]|nr:NUDIX domain-containing protein [Actinomycetota bacterium]
MIELPPDLPVVERSAVRLVVQDSADRVLLFHTRDPTYPELGTWWELPGGGIDAGETHVETAVRELREETGIDIDPDCVGPPTWRRDATFRFRGERRLQHEIVLSVRLGKPGPAVDGSRRVDFEDEDYFGFRWWAVADLVASGERFYPGRLPELLPAFLRGLEIDEPFELWS